MGKNVSSALEALIANTAKAKERGAYASDLALAKKAGKSDKTIKRILNKENEPALDTVTAIAEALQMEPWQLIRPEGYQPSLPGIADALDILIKVAGLLPPAERKELAEAAALLSQVPDSAELRARVLNALLRQTPPQAGRPPDDPSGEIEPRKVVNR